MGGRRANSILLEGESDDEDIDVLTAWMEGLDAGHRNGSHGSDNDLDVTQANRGVSHHSCWLEFE